MHRKIFILKQKIKQIKNANKPNCEAQESIQLKAEGWQLKTRVRQHYKNSPSLNCWKIKSIRKGKIPFILKMNNSLRG